MHMPPVPPWFHHLWPYSYSMTTNLWFKEHSTLIYITLTLQWTSQVINDFEMEGLDDIDFPKTS